MAVMEEKCPEKTVKTETGREKETGEMGLKKKENRIQRGICKPSTSDTKSIDAWETNITCVGVNVWYQRTNNPPMAHKTNPNLELKL